MDSFDAGDGGWNSDITFERKNVSINALKERLPVPATITSLINNYSQDDDAYVIGNYNFTTVQTVGILKSLNEVDGTITYTLADPENPSKEFVAVKFSCSENDRNVLVDDTISIKSRVVTIGKLKAFDDGNKIMIFTMNRVDDKDYTIFKLEAKVAKLFYEKDIIDKMRSGSLKRAHGMLAPPWTKESPTSPPPSKKIHIDEKCNKNTSQIIVATTSAHITYNGEKKMIYDYLKTQSRLEVSSAEGIPFHIIHEKVKHLTVKKLQGILDDMITDGSIFSTIDDYYIAIKSGSGDF